MSSFVVEGGHRLHGEITPQGAKNEALQVISAEHFSRLEASAKAEHGADYKVPHYDLPDGTVKVPAAWMIEQCGWKGRRSGGAAVYEKQPLVIVNYTGEAYPEEIIGLERRIIDSVKAKFSIELHPEVEHI